MLLREVAAVFTSSGGRPPSAEFAANDGLILVCAWCARVRSPAGHWIPVRQFLSQESHVVITHGICTECARVFQFERH